MKYAYYPGCSLKTTGLQYDLSAKAVMRLFGSQMEEIDDWNCCGSTASDMISPLLSVSLAARNLAIAEERNATLVTTCSSCFLNLYRVAKRLERDPELSRQLDEVLLSIGKRYHRTVKVRHLLDVIANDIGVDAVKARLKKSFAGLKVAPYYGCMTVRPYMEFDGPDLPNSMDSLVSAMGAEVIPFNMKTHCCGGVLINTKKNVGLKLVSDLLTAAASADFLVTVCPLCQMNLDAYQREAARFAGIKWSKPVLYLTQMMALAFDLPREDIRLDLNMVSADQIVARLGSAASVTRPESEPALSF
jgi:heterodisulfide reductase subunit B2